MNLAQFEARMRQIAELTENNLGVTMKRTAFRALVGSVRGTPADTGRGRSNYQINFGRRGTSTRPPFAPGRRIGIAETTNARAVESQARRKLRSIPNDRIIRTSSVQTNPLEYVAGLNDGNSRQAPAGFIERAAQAARRLPCQVFTLRRKLNF